MTYMHVHTHTISSAPADGRRHHHQGILSHKVPYTSLPPSVVGLGGGLEVELESLRTGDEEDDTADVPQ